VLAEFSRHFGVTFRDSTLLKLALTHRSYLSVTGQGPRESNERLEFLGDSVLGLVTSEFLYRRHPDDHEGQLTKTKSLLVSKAILSRRALRMGLGRFVLMSHSEVESGGRQRLSIIADAFESVLGSIYLDQGFEAARTFITHHLLSESDAITSDKRHTNYKSHLQEYVQNAFRTHPVYRIRSEYGPDHSKHFMVEVMVGKRTLGEGRGHNKKEAEQAAARAALEQVERVRRDVRTDDARDDDDLDDDSPPQVVSPPRGTRRGRDDTDDADSPRPGARRERAGRGEVAGGGRVLPAAVPEPPARVEDDGSASDDDDASGTRRRRSRRGGRGRHGGARGETEQRPAPAPAAPVTWEEDDDWRNESSERAPAQDPISREREPEPDLDRTTAPDFIPEPPATTRSEPAPPATPDSASPSAPPRAVSFGRGRRRAGGVSPVAATPVVEPLEDRRVDPYDPPLVPTTPTPVVDVAPAEPVESEETARERAARIQEMERALDNFGRRSLPDSGRRGRRR
jgi:ribonuclease-3